MTHLGRDFSSYQGSLSDADVEGIDFAYVKVTEGASYKNPDAVQQVAKLRQHDVKIGYYHFLDEPGTSSLGDQLDNFHRFAQALGAVSLPLAIDCEQRGSSWQALASDMAQFATNVESWNLWVPNRRSVFYLNLNFYDNLPGFPWGRWTWLADPNPGAPHKPCLILQTAPRPVSSTDLKSVDPDTFEGSDADWATFTNSAPAPDPVQDTSPLPAVPGYGLPGTPELAVIGQIVGAGGLYRGRNALNGVGVYAGLGNPTTWHAGFYAQALPVGTPLAVAYADRANVGTVEVTEYL